MFQIQYCVKKNQTWDSLSVKSHLWLQNKDIFKSVLIIVGKKKIILFQVKYINPVIYLVLGNKFIQIKYSS